MRPYSLLPQPSVTCEVHVDVGADGVPVATRADPPCAEVGAALAAWRWSEAPRAWEAVVRVPPTGVGVEDEDPLSRGTPFVDDPARVSEPTLFDTGHCEVRVRVEADGLPSAVEVRPDGGKCPPWVAADFREGFEQTQWVVTGNAFWTKFTARAREAPDEPTAPRR